MVAKLVLGLIAIVVIVVATVFVAFQYFKQREEHRHEKEMLREQRDAELLTEDSYIEQELDAERERE